jgi:hypothetical protein
MCLEVFDVMFGDTRDSNGAERFLQLNLHNLYRPFDYQATLRAFFPSKSVSSIYLTPPIIGNCPTLLRNFSFKRELLKRDRIVAPTKPFPSIQLRTDNF